MTNQPEITGIIHIQTPFRVSFFGGGTDFQDYFDHNPGAVIGTTLNRYSYVMVNFLTRLLDKRIRLSYSKLEIVDRPEELEHPIVRSVLAEYEHLWPNGFMDIHSFADLPARSGMGSSSAFTVGFLQALYALNGMYRSPHELAAEAINIERNKIGEKGGWQDQIHCAFGGLNRIDFHKGSFTVTPLPIRAGIRSCLERSMMLFFVNMCRSSTVVQEKVLARENSNSRQNLLAKIYGQVEKAQACLFSAQSDVAVIERFGCLLDEAWRFKREMSSAVSTPFIDECYMIAKKSGAYGGKICGAGSGGFLAFIVPEHRQEAVRAALSETGVIEVQARFSNVGSRIVFSG